MSKLRLVLVDDQALFREGLRTLLGLVPDFEIVAEARNGHEAVEQARRLKPDVMLMDLRMPGLSGVEATRAISAAKLPTRVLVLSTFDDDADISAAFAAGAVGYLLKDVPSEKLSDAIRLAARGESVLEPSVATKVIKQFTQLQNRQQRRAVQPLVEPLSTRELQVLEQLTTGKSNKEIAADLSIAEGTVKNHMSQVLAKLGVLDRTQAALRARDLGLL
ncbi:MAG: response regulator transcription factor [Opitutaceae bacterium]